MNTTHLPRPIRLGAVLLLAGLLVLPSATVPVGAAPLAEDGSTTEAPLDQQFEDVTSSNPFSAFINSLFLDLVVSGYPCGGPGEPCGPNSLPYYRPNNGVNRAQMAKFVDNARHLPGITIDTATDPQPISASTGAPTGIGLEGVHSSTLGASPGVRGSTNSTAANAVGVEGVVNSTSPGGLSVGVRGVNNGTGSFGIGVFGSHAGNGWGVYGLSAGGRGVFGSSADGQGIYGLHAATNGTAAGVYGSTASTDANATGIEGVVSSSAAGALSAGVRGTNNGTGSFGMGVFGSHAGNGWGVYGLSAGGRGVFGSSAGAEGVYGLHTATTGTAPGVYGSTASTAPNAAGIQGVVSSAAPGGYSAGVRGTNNGVGNSGIGVYGSHAGGGWGVYGTSIMGVGVYGVHTAITGTLAGVYGSTASTADDARAIEGVVTSSAPGSGSAGVYGRNQGTGANGAGMVGMHDGDGPGVVGGSQRGFGIEGTSTDNSGIWGGSLNSNGVEGYSWAGHGVYAESDGYGVAGAALYASHPGPGYAGYFHGDSKFEGNVFVTGDLWVDGFCCAAEMGAFRIDDPQDPSHQYLNHAAVASNELLDLYNGTVVLDAQGQATVELPSWFTALNGEFRYQLTPIGAPGPNLYISQEIANNHFGIAGGTPGGKISWQVTGVRKDPYAAAHPVAVKEQKPSDAQGTYLYPEGYGQPETARYDPKKEKP